MESESKEHLLKTSLSGPSGDCSVMSKQEKVTDFISRFTWTWTKALSDTNKGNFAFSPIRVGSTILATFLGSDGTTREELMSSFPFIQDEDELKNEYQALLNIINANGNDSKNNNNNNPSFLFSTSQKLLHSAGDALKEEYLEMLQSVLKSEVQALDFTAKVGAFRKLCLWLDTVGMNGLNTSDIKAALNWTEILPRLVFLSTLKFSGSLDMEFQYSRQECFFDVTYHSGLSCHAERVPISKMLCAEAEFSFAVFPQLDARAIAIPFEEGNFSLLIFLPKGKAGLDQLQHGLRYYNNVKDIVKQFDSKRKLHLRMPYFRIEQCLNMNSALKTLGAVSVFDDRNANFGMLEKYDEHVFVSGLIHAVQVDIHRGHAAAAAKKRFDWNPSSDSLEFHVTHPFFFMVYDEVTQNIAVAGRITNPLMVQ